VAGALTCPRTFRISEYVLPPEVRCQVIGHYRDELQEELQQVIDSTTITSEPGMPSSDMPLNSHGVWSMVGVIGMLVVRLEIATRESYVAMVGLFFFI